MRQERQKPTIDEKSGAEVHPAYAMIGAYRVSASPPGHALYGSDFLHQHYMVVRIVEGYVHRDDTNHDYYGGGKQIIEIALTYAQWVTFISETNVGHGTPATIQWREGVGDIPGIDLRIDRREVYRQAIDARLQRALGLMDEFASDSALSAARREKARYAAQELRSNLPYIAEQFDEHAEKTIEKAKVEVGAYIEAAIRRAGLTALGAPEAPMLTLPASSGEGVES